MTKNTIRSNSQTAIHRIHMDACPRQKQQPLPEEHQDSLWKRLEVVVAVDMCSVHHCYFPKHLKNTKGHIFLNRWKAIEPPYLHCPDYSVKMMVTNVHDHL